MYPNKIPTIDEAQLILKEAAQLNPGPWVQHSAYAGQAAKLIAENCPGMDADKACVLGMLHDIGRRVGVTNMRHVIDGYNFLAGIGFETNAKICLTHSFPGKNIKEAFGEWDCSNEEYTFAKDYINSVEYDDYDRLIQLCDAIAMPSGFVLMEKRMLEVALRHGIHEHIIPKWKATFEIKKHFENLMRKSIYRVLPGVVENTFEI